MVENIVRLALQRTDHPREPANDALHALNVQALNRVELLNRVEHFNNLLHAFAECIKLAKDVPVESGRHQYQ